MLGLKGVHSRAQVLIDDDLSVDFSPDAYYHAALFGADMSAVKYLLVTHSHMDHFAPSELILRGYKYATDMTSPTLDIFGNAEICAVYREGTKRELRQDVSERITLHEVAAFEPFTFGEYTAVALPARHTSQDPFVFLIEKGNKRYLHLSDTGLLPEATYEYLEAYGGKPFDLVTLDCTFLYQSSEELRRHMGLDDNKKVLRRLQDMGLVDQKTKRVITHFSHNSSPTPELLARAEKEYGVIAAYDGLELNV